MKISPAGLEAAREIRTSFWRRVLRKPMRLLERLRLARFTFDPERVAGMNAVADDIRFLAIEAEERRAARQFESLPTRVETLADQMKARAREAMKIRTPVATPDPNSGSEWSGPKM